MKPYRFVDLFCGGDTAAKKTDRQRRLSGSGQSTVSGRTGHIKEELNDVSI